MSETLGTGGGQDERQAMWQHERPTRYDQLNWIKSELLLKPYHELSKDIQADIYVDLGTGTGEVLAHLEPHHGQAIGVDLSDEMLVRAREQNQNSAELLQADATDLPFPNEYADLVTSRMLLHDLEEPGKVISEAWRILKPGGRLIIGEYVVDSPSAKAISALQHFESGKYPFFSMMGPEEYKEPSEKIVTFLRRLFSLKHEPHRNLWTGEQFRQLIDQNTSGQQNTKIHYSLRYHEVANWLENSGFPIEECKQVGIIDCLSADNDLKEIWPLDITWNGKIMPVEIHEELLMRYSSATSAEREEMNMDARFYAAFAHAVVDK